MGLKTRFLQLSDTTMMEYIIEDEASIVDKGTGYPDKKASYIFTQLKNNHFCLFSPCSYEVFKNNEDKYEKRYISNGDCLTINTLNHLAVPEDSKDSVWFTFLDPDYQYVSEESYSDISDPISYENDIKLKEYSKYCTNPFDKDSAFAYCTLSNVNFTPGWDEIKLYFTTGYDFSDIYGALLRISVDRKDGTILDLCNLFYNKSNVYKYIQYLGNPIIFGNFIYDKYLSIKVPSIDRIDSSTYLEESVVDENTGNEFKTLKDVLSISYSSTIKIMFSYIDSEHKTLTDATYTVEDAINEKFDAKNVICDFSRTSTIKGIVPRNKVASDNLGVYIASNPEKPYIEFYGTWKNVPLNSAIVQSFNETVELYDKSIIKRPEITYEVDRDYVPEYDMKKWVAIHEIKCSFVDTDEKVLKEESYSISQVFVNDPKEVDKFYYRPIFFDENIAEDLAHVVLSIDYTLRFINIEDSVQFTKKGSLSIADNELMKFWGKGTKLTFGESMPYKIYNKIIENKQNIIQSQATGDVTKYVKVFYDTTDITLETSGGAVGNNNYTLIISKAPKNYKFIFKQLDINGNRKFVDLTDSYYKLYTKDRSGNQIIIDPTYSSNMNLLLGELEFNINVSSIDKLYAVPEEDRYISIVAYNSDNSVSSMYDMRYTF